MPFTKPDAFNPEGKALDPKGIALNSKGKALDPEGIPFDIRQLP